MVKLCETLGFSVYIKSKLESRVSVNVWEPGNHKAGKRFISISLKSLDSALIVCRADCPLWFIKDPELTKEG